MILLGKSKKKQCYTKSPSPVQSSVDNDNQYYGLGVNAGVMRYQSEGDHVFYGSVNSTTSKELLRIRGTGNVNMGSNVGFYDGSISNSGGHLYSNISGQSMVFNSNSRNSFYWRNITTAGTNTPYTDLMQLSTTSLNVNTPITSNGFQLLSRGMEIRSTEGTSFLIQRHLFAVHWQ